MDSPFQIWKINSNIKVLCPVIQFHWEKELYMGLFWGVPPLDKYRQLIFTVSRIYLSRGRVLVFGCPVQRGQSWSCIHTSNTGRLSDLYLCVHLYVYICTNILYNICILYIYIEVNIIHENKYANIPVYDQGSSITS